MPIPIEPEETPITVTVVGGGSSAHVLIPFLGSSGHVVNLMTRRPSSWKKLISVELHSSEDGNDEADADLLPTCVGAINKCSSDPADVIPEADVIILCMPVHKYRDALNRLAPHINTKKKEVFVGTIYGQAGFNWMVHEIERKYGLKNIVAFAVGLIPWICRTLEYGSKGVNYGCKKVNIAAVTPADRFGRLNEIFLDAICYDVLGRGKFVQACSFLSLTLSVDNQIIHPSRCYGLWTRYPGAKWKTKEDIPYFYRDFDQTSAEYIMRIDADYSKVRDAVRKRFPQRPFQYMLDYLALEELTHNVSRREGLLTDIKKSFQESEQLGQILTPCNAIHELDIQCRFFTDDIPYGLLIAKWIAQELDVETPFIDEVIAWASKLRGWTFTNEDGTIDTDYCLKNLLLTGIPPAYGILDVSEILD
jgi:hypothetical protein